MAQSGIVFKDITKRYGVSSAAPLVVKGISFNNPALQQMSGGSFKSETIPISAVGANVTKVQQMLDRVGFK